MDWSQTLKTLQAQGPVYWAAAAAVAAGATLLLAAAWLRFGRRRRVRRAAAMPPRVQATATGYTATAPLPAPAATAPARPDPRLGELRQRLGAAAERLERLQGGRETVGGTGLKTSVNRVEYVHRSGRA